VYLPVIEEGHRVYVRQALAHQPNVRHSGLEYPSTLNDSPHRPRSIRRADAPARADGVALIRRATPATGSSPRGILKGIGRHLKRSPLSFVRPPQAATAE
jgi:hypothetical protein